MRWLKLYFEINIVWRIKAPQVCETVLYGIQKSILISFRIGVLLNFQKITIVAIKQKWPTIIFVYNVLEILKIKGENSFIIAKLCY